MTFLKKEIPPAQQKRISEKQLVELLNQYFHNDGFAFFKIDEVQNIADSLLFIVSEGPECILERVKGIPDSLNINIFDDLPRRYNADEIRDELDQWILQKVNDGYFLIKIEIGNITVTSLKNDKAGISLELNVTGLEPIIIDRYLFQGLKQTRKEILMRELNWSIGMPFTQDIKDGIIESLNKLQIFETIGEPEIVDYDSSSAILIKLVENQTMTFDGIVGYIPSQKNTGGNRDGYFTGLLDLNFGNLLGTGRKLRIHWKKPDALSDEFLVRYKEPWILNLPLNAIIGLQRRVQDTLFLKQGYEFELEYPVSYRWRLYARFQRDFTVPDSLAAVNLKLTRNRHDQYVTGLSYDNRDFPVNPGSGALFDLSFAYGNKKIDGPQYLLERDSTIVKNQESQEIDLNAAYFLTIMDKNVLAIKMKSAFLFITPNGPEEADMFWFGGATTLRGYKENQFRSDRYAIGTFEYRFLTGRRSRLFAFSDVAFFNTDENIIHRTGYGVGIRMDTALGIMAIDYGLPEGEPFSQGKIHFGIVNEF